MKVLVLEQEAIHQLPNGLLSVNLSREPVCATKKYPPHTNSFVCLCVMFLILFHFQGMIIHEGIVFWLGN